MLLKIHRSRSVTEEERRSLFGWGEDIFRIDEYQLEWRNTEWSFVGCAEGGPVSHVGVLSHTVRVESHQIRVGGIAAVVTIPSARGNGYARQSLEAATAFLSDDVGVEFGFLFCLDEMIPFYMEMGWQEVADRVIVDQPQAKITYPMNAMILAFTERKWPGGPVELDSLPW